LPGFFFAVSTKPWKVVNGAEGWLTSSIGTRPAIDEAPPEQTQLEHRL
jgi:hypothetical protein